MAVKVVIVNGSVRTPSRTGTLLSAVSAAVAAQTETDVQTIHLAGDAPAIFSALKRDALSSDGERIIRMVEAAELLLVGTSVYRARGRRGDPVAEGLLSSPLP